MTNPIDRALTRLLTEVESEALAEQERMAEAERCALVLTEPARVVRMLGVEPDPYASAGLDVGGLTTDVGAMPVTVICERGHECVPGTDCETCDREMSNRRE